MSDNNKENGPTAYGARAEGSNVFVASGVQPDEIRTWYEVPESVANEVRRTIDPDETFAECLLRLLLEREGTYRQVVRENKRLRSLNQSEPTGCALVAAVHRYLQVDGSHGRFDALALHEARKALVAIVGAPGAA